MNALSTSYCHAKLPNAGLGNKLFVWAKAHMFSKLNNMPLVVTGWTQLQLAPLIKGFDFRLYWNYFEKIDQVGARLRHYCSREHKIVREPPVGLIKTTASTIYEYSAVPHWNDYFGDIRDYREEIRSALLAMLTTRRRRELERQTPPIIAVNIRMGDFRKLKPHENFSQLGGVRTPLNYFVDLICEIRKVHSSTLPVEIVNDGSRSELKELLCLPAVSVAPKRSKIVDILMMSRSRILICSAGSTFSYWAGFLGESALILHPDHIHQAIRPGYVNSKFYEGPLAGFAENWPSLFVGNLKDIKVRPEIFVAAAGILNTAPEGLNPGQEPVNSQ